MKGPLTKPLNQLYQNMSNGSLGYKDLKESGVLVGRQQDIPHSKSPVPHRVTGRTPNKMPTPKMASSRQMRIVVHDVDGGDANPSPSEAKKSVPASSQTRKYSTGISKIKNELEVINLEATLDRKSKTKLEARQDDSSASLRREKPSNRTQIHGTSSADKYAPVGSTWINSPKTKLVNYVSEARYNQEKLIFDIKSAVKNKFPGPNVGSTSSSTNLPFSEGSKPLANTVGPETKESHPPKFGRFRNTILSLIAERERPFFLAERHQWTLENVPQPLEDTPRTLYSEELINFRNSLLSAYESNSRLNFQRCAGVRDFEQLDCKEEDLNGLIESSAFDPWQHAKVPNHAEYSESISEKQPPGITWRRNPADPPFSSDDDSVSDLLTPDSSLRAKRELRSTPEMDSADIRLETEPDVYRPGVEVISPDDISSANQVYEKIIAKKANEEINKKFQQLLLTGRAPRAGEHSSAQWTQTGWTGTDGAIKQRDKLLVKDPDCALFGLDQYYDAENSAFAGHLEFFSS